MKRQWIGHNKPICMILNAACMALDPAITRTFVKGDKRGKLLLYALSTCPWCNRMKRFLNELGVEYEYVDADLLDRKSRKQVEAEVRKWNPNESYPTIVIDDRISIIGNKEDEIRQALGL